MSSTINAAGLGEHHSYNVSMRVQIVHRTPRVQCFNSSYEKVSILGGMALNCSLPDMPIPSSLPFDCHKQMIWLGDVKPKKYIMPSKDKFVLCEEHGMIISSDATSGEGEDRHPGDGLILLDVTPYSRESGCLKSSHESLEKESNAPHHNNDYSDIHRTLARLRLTNGTPISLAMHPSGEWMVVGYGLNGRRDAMKSLELVCLRR
jgi:hypothetical protein